MKNLIVLILCGCMLLDVLTACGSDEKPKFSSGTETPDVSIVDAGEGEPVIPQLPDPVTSGRVSAICPDGFTYVGY